MVKKPILFLLSLLTLVLFVFFANAGLLENVDKTDDDDKETNITEDEPEKENKNPNKNEKPTNTESDKKEEKPTEDSGPKIRNLALNASYSAPEAIRGYTAKLTDGVVSDSFEAGSSLWYGIFCNSAATDSNAPAGKASVVVDLGNYCDITSVGIHYASMSEAAVAPPANIEVYGCTVPQEGFYDIGTIETEYNNGQFWVRGEFKSKSVRYVRFDVTLGDYWAMLDEIEIFGIPSEKGVPNMLGDINGDSKTDVMDYVLLKRHCFGTYNLTEEQKVIADVNLDGAVDLKDYTALKRFCFGNYYIKDLNSYEFNIVHEEQVFVSDDRLGDLSDITGVNIAIFGNSFIYTSQICEIYNELAADNGIRQALVNCSYEFDSLYDASYVAELKSRGVSAIFLCGFYSSSDLQNFETIVANCENAGIKLVIFPAHNENRQVLNLLAGNYPQLYVMDWKAEIDLLIKDGVDRWDMCVDDEHDHSTALAGYVGAHMIYRAIHGEIPDSSDMGDYIQYRYIKSKLGNYIKTGIIE